MTPVETTKAGYAAFARNDPSVLFGAMDAAVTWNEAEGNPLADRNPCVVVPGRHGGTMQAGGARLDAPFCHVRRFRDGKIVAFQQYTDSAQWARLVA